jgi:hypothetical protein
VDNHANGKDDWSYGFLPITSLDGKWLSRVLFCGTLRKNAGICFLDMGQRTDFFYRRNRKYGITGSFRAALCAAEEDVCVYLR